MPASLFRTVSPVSYSEPASGVRVLERKAPWVWWHLLSLDAPTVAVVWCWFLGAAFGLHLSPINLLTLALGTWCVYVADRLLDGWRSADTLGLRDRHWFYLRYRRPFVIAWGIAGIPLAYLIFSRTQPRVRHDDIILSLIGVAYFLRIHARPPEKGTTRRFPTWLPKELAVGVLFAIATAVPAWEASGRSRLLILAIVAFGAACWLNCVSIQVWEDAEAKRDSFAIILSPPRTESSGGGLTEFLGHHLTAFSIAVGVAAAGMAAITAGSLACLLFLSVALSAILFLALIRNDHRLNALSLRIAADAALLTPLLFLFAVR